jgi:hypothetical protein
VIRHIINHYDILRLKKITITPKVIVKMTRIPGAIQRYAIEIGLDDHTVGQLGHDWQLLCEAWVGAELALSRLGGPPALPALEFKPPQCLIEWSRSRVKKEEEPVDFAGIEDQMVRWWKRCISDGTSANRVLEKSWCRSGLGGIVLILLGLKEWGKRIHGKAGQEKWLGVLSEVNSVFTAIPSANIL